MMLPLKGCLALADAQRHLWTHVTAMTTLDSIPLCIRASIKNSFSQESKTDKYS